MSIPLVFTLFDVVHALDQHVAPDVQREHPRQQYQAIEEPQPEVDLSRFDLELQVGADLQDVKGEEGDDQPWSDRFWAIFRVAVILAEGCQEKHNRCYEAYNVNPIAYKSLLISLSF